VHVAVTAVGLDRPGIVAAVTKVLYDLGGNIEDSRMALLGGHFAMVLIVSLPAGSDAGALDAALQEPARALGLSASARPVSEAPSEHDAGAPYAVSVYGADHPGIVWRVSQELAAHHVNITDLATRVVGGEPAVYVMILEVQLPSGADAATIESSLKSLASELSVEIALNPIDAETL
jgi:glycine cleavage system transcriptional repressor